MSEINISICIPAYKRVVFLKGLLESVIIQSYRNFELIITDDSDDNSVLDLVNDYSDKIGIRYFKNEKPLGTPANWNFAISQAKGEWIKLMHDDDWFASSDSLEKMIEATDKSDFIFCGYNEIELDTMLIKRIYLIPKYHQILLKLSPHNLLKENFIGQPSTTLIKKDSIKGWYNENLKWVVDIEFYIRTLKANKSWYAIKEPLINIGLSDTQVTKQVFRRPEVEIPENLYLLNKISTASLRNIFVYDYYWRLLRNLAIRNVQQMAVYITLTEIPEQVVHMVSFQRKIPLRLLQLGILSKCFMLLSYLFNKN